MRKKIGLLGGLSWHSTQLYYQYLNQEYARHLIATLPSKEIGNSSSALSSSSTPPFHSASVPLLINSLDFHHVLEGFKNRPRLIQDLIQECSIFANQCTPILITSNTVHALYTDLQHALPDLHWMHIADCLAQECIEKGITRLGLLGTRYTVSQKFYRSILEKKGIKLMILDRTRQKKLDFVIAHYLTQGQPVPSSIPASSFVDDLDQQGVQAIALACTELPLWITPHTLSPLSLPLLDTALIHCQRALSFYLSMSSPSHPS